MPSKQISVIIAGCIFLIIISTYERLQASPWDQPCYDCHTMHNSQNGSPVVAGGPYPYLNNSGSSTSCWGCHAKGEAINVSAGSPQIRHTNPTDLAGGNFAYITGLKALITATVMSAGHNVVDTGVNDTLQVNGLPGDQHNNSALNNPTWNLTCAGQFGCHGDRTKPDEYTAMTGSHHTRDTIMKFGTLDEALQGSSVGLSYRFLLGVKGGEVSGWVNLNSNTHNEYKGAVSPGVSSATGPANNTISGLCAECHGYFHGSTSAETGGGSPWLRHPTDIVLPASGEYAAVTSTYNVDVPVARATIPTLQPLGTVTAGVDIVMCLSCHKAHATPYANMLRWDYSSVAAGGGPDNTRCFFCHTGKDDGL